MHRFTRFTPIRCLPLLALAAACDPDIDPTESGLVDGEEPDSTTVSTLVGEADPDGDHEALVGGADLGASTEPSALTTSSFHFQHPLIGGSYELECDFNDLQCAAPGKYHTGIDWSASTSTAIRASNFGVRTLVQNRSSGDHGMGNAVAVQYLLADGTYLYATDNHMSSHHPLSARPDGTVAVPRGTKLGNVGGSGYGSLNYWGNHDHHEMKTTNTLASSCGGTYYGYTPNGATNYCYKNPAAYFGLRRVLIPEFSLSNSGWGDYDVLYGVVNTPIYAQIRVENSSSTFSLAGVSGRAGWGGTVVDFPMAANVGPGTYSVTRSRTFSTPGDYRLAAAVQSGGAWRGGYSVIFSVLAKSTDFIRDNDMGTGLFKSGGLGLARFDGYGYGAYAATGNSGAWAQWYTQRAGAFRLWAYVGSNGVGTVRFKIYPTGSGSPIWSDPINLASTTHGWVQIKVGATTSWNFTSSGYVGLSADLGSSNEVYLFDAIKFVSV